MILRFSIGLRNKHRLQERLRSPGFQLRMSPCGAVRHHLTILGVGFLTCKMKGLEENYKFLPTVESRLPLFLRKGELVRELSRDQRSVLHGRWVY